jgi:hypothetical protein
MKREEERISKLFQQLKEEDERHAPSFAHDWNAALSRQEKLRQQWNAWRVAVAALLIVLGAGCAGWWMYARQSTKQSAPVAIVRPDRPVDSFTPLPVSPSPTPVKNPPNVTRRQRPSARPQPTAILISQWRSPTQSLLQIPGEQLLKRVPRLGESLVNIKVIIPNENN